MSARASNRFNGAYPRRDRKLDHAAGCALIWMPSMEPIPGGIGNLSSGSRDARTAPSMEPIPGGIGNVSGIAATDLSGQASMEPIPGGIGNLFRHERSTRRTLPLQWSLSPEG